jgi:hypothetical protein
MEYVIFGLLAYFIVGVGLLLRELLLYPETEADLHDLIGASIVCVVLWPFFVVWCLREWWAKRGDR